MTEPEKKKPGKRIDFVLAIKEENLAYIRTYLDNLKSLGFEIEESPGITVDSIFIKISLTPSAIVHFAELYDIGIEDPCKGEVIYTERIWRHPFRTPVSKIDRKKKGEVTNAERIMIADKVLQSAKYGPGESDYGIAKLMRLRIVQTAYPLHDGSLDDGDQGPPHERKLLLAHWSNLSKFHKEQPLDLIQKYFGVEVAFYFAWLEYFNLMLLLPAFFGFLVMIFALLSLTFSSMDEASIIIKEVCNAKDIFLCPTCEKRKDCRFQSFDIHCGSAKLIYIFDNHLAIYFAIFMSIWATLFIHLWKRKESSLNIRWNCSTDESETAVRQQYLEKATKAKINRITGEIDYYIPFKKRFPRYLISFGICFLLILVVAAVVIALIPFKIWFGWQLDSCKSLFLKTKSQEISIAITAIIKVCFMKLYAKVYALTIQVLFILTCKDLMGNLLSALIPACKRCFHRRKKTAQASNQVQILPQWEEEYYLEPVGRYFLLGEFMEMVIKYGLITFYAAAFPLGPLCAIVNNTFELRGDAYKLVRSYRRPIPLAKMGIGAWNGILLGMTYTSIAMSAFVLCFTSSHVTRLVYYFRHQRYNFHGYLQYTYAAYNTSAYPRFGSVKNYQEKCYVKNFYHIEEGRLYELNKRYWYDLTWKLVGVIFYENVVFVLSILLMYFISKYPRTVVEQLEYNEYQTRMAKIREADGGKARDKTQDNKTKSLINMSL